MGKIKKGKRSALNNLHKARLKAYENRRLKKAGVSLNDVQIKREIIDTSTYETNYNCGEGCMEEGYQQVEVKEEQEEDSVRNHASSSISPPAPPLSGGVVLPPMEEEAYYNDNHCIFCHQPMMKHDKQVQNPENILEANDKAMFILRKMLQIPKAMLADYLKSIGSPWHWVAVCEMCLPVVDQALTIEKKINQLEEKLKAYQRRIQLEIKSSWKNVEKRVPVRRKNAQLTRELKVSMVTSEIRHLIYSRNDTPEKSEDIPYHPIHDYLRLEEQSPPPSPSSPEPGERDDNGEPPNYNLVDSCSDGYQEEITSSERKKKRKQCEMKFYKTDKQDLTSGAYVCGSCPNLGTMSFISFMYHGLFHFRRPLKCNECGIYFSKTSEPHVSPFARIPGAHHRCSNDNMIQTFFSPGKIWGCAICKEKFPSDAERDAHETTCGSSFSSEGVHLKHECSTCPKKFRSIAEWILHRVLEHPQVASLGCFYCGEVFSIQTIDDIQLPNVTEINSHIHKKHGLFSSFKVPDDCDFCGSIFTRAVDLHSHLEDAHGLKTSTAYSCPLCKKSRFNQRGRLKQHITDVHLLKGQRLFPKEPFICEMCGHQTVTNLVALEHKFSCHGIEPEGDHCFFSCSEDECTFRTLIKGSLSRHLMKVHAAARKYVCRICGKGFLSSAHRSGHEQIHKNATLKPFQCEICGNSFALRNYLYIHMRLSHQNRPFASTHKKKPSRRRKVGDNVRIAPTSDIPLASNSSHGASIENQRNEMEHLCHQETDNRVHNCQSENRDFTIL